MAIVPAIGLVLFLVVTGVGFATWSRGGKKLALTSGTSVALCASILLRHNAAGLSYAFGAVCVILLFIVFATISRATWRRVRFEVLLGGAASVTLLASYSLTNIPLVAQQVLLVLVGVLMAAFIAGTLVRIIVVLRAAQAARTR